MNDTQRKTYDALCDHLRDTSRLEAVGAIIGWDEQTKMPSAAGPYRAEQMALLAGITHERHVDPKIGEWLDELEAALGADDPDWRTSTDDIPVVVRLARRDYDRRVKVPGDLVESLTMACVRGQQIWAAAREADDFQAFRPALEEIVKLKREEAEAIGYDDTPYDALLDEFEPGAKTTEVAALLADLRDRLVPLVAAIADSERRCDQTILTRKIPADRQAAFGEEVSRAMGFDFERGRIDTTTHPFCTTLGPADCRITTRYDESFWAGSLYGTMHESGHGMYEQGLPEAFYGLPLRECASLGVHESQSRLWENMVGRSRAFWEHFLPSAKRHFGSPFDDVTVDSIYFAVNDVRASLIRVEADEATYNLHIMIRFELEKEMLEGTLSPADLPDAWNERYEGYLGVRPPTDREGVLQDIHWSGGLIGYFPTYTLGNLVAAQLFEKAREDLGDIDAQIAAGDLAPLRDWLRANVHRSGSRLPADRLVEHVTGRPLSDDPMLDHLQKKLGPLYGIS